MYISVFCIWFQFFNTLKWNGIYSNYHINCFLFCFYLHIVCCLFHWLSKTYRILVLNICCFFFFTFHVFEYLNKYTYLRKIAFKTLNVQVLLCLFNTRFPYASDCSVLLKFIEQCKEPLHKQNDLSKNRISIHNA